MNKINQKPPAEREPKYLPYKSYHNNKPRNSKSSSQEEMQKKTTTSEAPKIEKSGKAEHASVARQVSGYKGDSTARGGFPASGRSALKHSESQTSEPCFPDYEKLKGDLALLRDAKCKLDEEITRLKTNNEDLKNENENLRHVITDLELKNEELTDQYELNSDQIKELLKLNDEKAQHLEKLESNISRFESEKNEAKSRSEELEAANKELIQLVTELHSMTEEKDRTVDHLSSFKKKWESYKVKLQNAMTEKEELANRIANDAKFVALLETDMSALQRKNEELKDKNEQLQRNVTERKKHEELLRQKYEELKKQHRSFKERGSRYLIYDRIDDLTKCGSDSLSSIIAREDTSNKNLRALSSSLMKTLSQKSKRSQDSIKEHEYYNLLHRSNESERVAISKRRK